MGSLPTNANEFYPTSEEHSKDVLYIIKKDPVVGRYMVASRDIQPGEVIFSDEAVAVGPDNSSKPLCLGCMTRKVSGNYLCRDCNWPLCSNVCAKSPNHIEECKLMKARGTKIKIPWFDKPCSYYDAILPLRVMLLKKTNPHAYNLISILMDHADDLDEATRKRRQTVVDFLRISCRLSQDFTEEELHHILGILSVNSFVVHDGGNDETSTDLIGLYPWTSIMSHHCIANTKITTRDDFSYVCEATIFIPEGEEIVTNYHHYHYQLYGTSYRRNDLKSTWSFDCLCKRCGDPTEMGTNISAVNCEECKFGYLLPIDSLNYSSEWLCNHCGTKVLFKTIDEKIKKFENEIDDISSKDAESYEKLLRRLRYHVHENHYWILDVKRRLIDIYGNKEGYELHNISIELLEKKVEYCEHLLSIASKLCPGPSEMRAYLLWELQGAQMRIVQYNWIRMKISTKTYLQGLDAVQKMLYDVIKIFGPIRLKSDEGQIGLMAKQGLQEVLKIVRQLTSSGHDNNTDDNENGSKSSIILKHKNRMSLSDSTHVLEKAISQLLTA